MQITLRATYPQVPRGIEISADIEVLYGDDIKPQIAEFQDAIKALSPRPLTTMEKIKLALG